MRFRSFMPGIALVALIYAALVALHAPFLRLPYFWDEAGYFIPAALDFYHHAFLIPRSTLSNGHTPLVPIYLGTLWHVFGFSPVVTRAAMLLTAAATVAATYRLGLSIFDCRLPIERTGVRDLGLGVRREEGDLGSGVRDSQRDEPPECSAASGALEHSSSASPPSRIPNPGSANPESRIPNLSSFSRHSTVANREIAAWGAGILALSPVFFAQSSLAHLDVTAALFTTLAVLALLRRHLPAFALAASLAVLSKETAVVLVPAACVAWILYRGLRFRWARAGTRGSGFGVRDSQRGEPRECSAASGAFEPSPSASPQSRIPNPGSGGTESRTSGLRFFCGPRTPDPETRVTWLWLLFPILVLGVWVAYYHHATGFWTGNREYLQYNLYSTLNPVRFLLTLLRRLYELLIAGFNWVLVLGAILGVRHAGRSKSARPGVRGSGFGIRREEADSGFRVGDSQSLITSEASAPPRIVEPSSSANPEPQIPNPALSSAFCLPPAAFWLLTTALVGVYLLMLSVVGGAVLPRYLLPVMPVYYLSLVALIWRFPKPWARGILTLAAACLVSAWFINPPGPFPYEDNVSYADFIQLHQQAAAFLEKQPRQPRILTAWPASDELTQPFLGYLNRPLRVVPLGKFEPEDFRSVRPDSFDLLYLYSRSWEPPRNWLDRSPWLRRLGRHYFDYSTQVLPETLMDRFHLMLVQQFERRGQWVRIYARQGVGEPTDRIHY